MKHFTWQNIGYLPEFSKTNLVIAILSANKKVKITQLTLEFLNIRVNNLYEFTTSLVLTKFICILVKELNP